MDLNFFTLKMYTPKIALNCSNQKNAKKCAKCHNKPRARSSDRKKVGNKKTQKSVNNNTHLIFNAKFMTRLSFMGPLKLKCCLFKFKLDPLKFEYDLITIHKFNAA